MPICYSDEYLYCYKITIIYFFETKNIVKQAVIVFSFKEPDTFSSSYYA